MPFDPTIYNLINQKNMVCEEFLVGGNFTSKSDVVFLEGCAGGGGGHATGSGGAAGAGCDWLSVPVVKGATYDVVIGAGGAIGGDGGVTYFKKNGASDYLLYLPGGKAGVVSGSGMAQGGLKRTVPAVGAQVNAESIGAIITGASVLHFDPGSGLVVNIGNGRFRGDSGAGGMFGEGGTSGNAAAANSGAGGGTNAAGGSGRMRVYYLK